MRKTLLASVAVAVNLLISLPASAQMSMSLAFLQGNADRQSWETWFNSLSGEYQAGALFWSGQRSRPHPAPCVTQGGRDLGEWSAGCLAAQQRLALTDVRRKGEPEYRLGWNAWSPQIAPLQPMIAAAPPSAPPATAFAPPPSAVVPSTAFAPPSAPQTPAAVVPSTPDSSQASRWADVLPQVKQRCASEWQDNFRMQAYCVDQQRIGWEKVNADQPPPAVMPSAPAQRSITSASINDEDGLNQIVQAAIRQYREGQNDMQKGASRPMRAQAIAHLLPSRHVRGWIGTVTQLTTNGDGKGVMVIQIGKDTFVRTWNNALSDITDDTLIDPLSSLFQTVSQLRVGQKVQFSGVFMVSPSDYIKESSLTLGGSITGPEFIMKFESVTPISDAQS